MVLVIRVVVLKVFIEVGVELWVVILVGGIL